MSLVGRGGMRYDGSMALLPNASSRLAGRLLVLLENPAHAEGMLASDMDLAGLHANLPARLWEDPDILGKLLRSGSVSVAQALIDRGVELGFVSPSAKVCPLGHALFNPDVRVLSKLLDHGLDPADPFWASSSFGSSSAHGQNNSVAAVCLAENKADHFACLVASGRLEDRLGDLAAKAQGSESIQCFVRLCELYPGYLNHEAVQTLREQDAAFSAGVEAVALNASTTQAPQASRSGPRL